jgi:hypothetical protein
MAACVDESFYQHSVAALFKESCITERNFTIFAAQ